MNFNTLYYKDPYQREFETRVKDVFKEKDYYKIELEDTCFFPEGGGQKPDTGFIGEIEVFDCQEKDNKIYHYTKETLEIGSKVFCKINFEKRLEFMRNHTGEHIVSGLICHKYNARNVGFHMGSDFVTMDFTVNLSKEQVEEIEKIANNVIMQNLKIDINIYSNEEAKNIEYRSKINLDGDVRIVNIPGVDICACCGLHLKTTGEVGLIKILSVEKYKTGCRVYMLTGHNIINDYNEKYKTVNDISTLLSCKIEEVFKSVEELKNQVMKLEHEKNELRMKSYIEKISKLEKEDMVIFEENDILMQDMKNICNILDKDITKDISVVLSKSEGDNLYRFYMMSKKYDLRNLVNYFKENYEAKGGGKEHQVQGQMKYSEDVIKYLKTI